MERSLNYLVGLVKRDAWRVLKDSLCEVVAHPINIVKLIKNQKRNGVVLND
jgi:hypothetical protein